ncbi:ORF6N domain-containing protein [Treponema succinifaciens]|uniref:ORF6N domain-containing protein n=1 Tax=Treponema succinifaciens TaxID=167 RepID=UPI003F7F9668
MKNEIALHNSEWIKDKIYTIRGEQVMLDFELAEIYGYETKRFNEQVKNNIERFDDDFRFQLTDDEFNTILRSKNSTSSWGGTRYKPYAFTEQGIYMLMTVLKGELAFNGIPCRLGN